ncbi:MAG TPA: DUF222 domain-containing protein [Actinocrinis sp.]|nr:DUF222 domain-containing protein [Actinocrinis sp.]
MQNEAQARAEEIERVHQQVCANYGRLLALVAKADEEQDGLMLGYGGTAPILSIRLRSTRSQSFRMVNAVRGLRWCPQTRAALEEGLISWHHVDQILAGVRAVSHMQEGPQRAEEVLLALAVEQDPGAVRSAVAGIKQALDPVAAARILAGSMAVTICRSTKPPGAAP